MEHFLDALYEYDNWPKDVTPAFVELAEDRGLIFVSVDTSLRGLDAAQAEKNCKDWFALIRRRSGVFSDKDTLRQSPSRFAEMFVGIGLGAPQRVTDLTGIDAAIHLECSGSYYNATSDQSERLKTSAPLRGTSFSVERLK